ncbi:MAG: hypothetical protein Q4D19_09725 [Lautropia sp.]|nr:hypothetical protein [Lautropia sp.]
MNISKARASLKAAMPLSSQMPVTDEAIVTQAAVSLPARLVDAPMAGCRLWLLPAR